MDSLLFIRINKNKMLLDTADCLANKNSTHNPYNGNDQHNPLWCPPIAIRGRMLHRTIPESETFDAESDTGRETLTEGAIGCFSASLPTARFSRKGANGS